MGQNISLRSVPCRTFDNFGSESIDLLRWLLSFNLLYQKNKEKKKPEFETKPSIKVKILCTQFSVYIFTEGRKKLI